MTDPKLVVTETDWDDMSPKQQAKITYNTVISMREDVIGLSKKVDSIVSKPPPPCEKMDNRVEKLEKWSKLKAVATIASGFISGFGGSHIPK